MSVDDVFTMLGDIDAVLYVEDGRLRYAGPKLAASDALLDAIDVHRVVLTEWFTYAPGKRCRREDCYRLRTVGDSTSCAEHRAQIDATVMPWEAGAGRE